MKHALKLNWVGPWIPQRNLGQWKAASPAAMKWQKHMVDALVVRGVDVHWTYYRPDPYWPRGRLLPRQSNRDELLPPFGNSEELSYVNLPVMRRYSLLRSCFKKSTEIPQQKKIIISYNAPDWYLDVLFKIRSKLDVSWICIVADDVAPKGADGYIFLSYAYFEQFSETERKMHLDGGIYRTCRQKTNGQGFRVHKKRRFMYSGSLGKWGGVSTLLDALELIDNDDFDVLISGSGVSKENLLRMNRDARVKYLGIVDDTQLTEAYAATDIFLNPRPTRIVGGEYNFPSKILDYLGWEKPIISTWTDGLAPEYRHVLNVVDDNPEALAAEMMKDTQEVPKHIKIAEWGFRFNKTWHQQAGRLLRFIRQVCSDSSIT